MDREAMRILLLYLFVGVAIITVLLVSIGTLLEFSNPGYISDRAWRLVAWGWMAVFGEIVGFLLALAKNLFGLRSDYLAHVIASGWARDIVEKANGDPRDLNTSYSDMMYWIPSGFRKQGRGLQKVLVEEFEAETLSEVRRIPELRTWKPPKHKIRIEPEQVTNSE
ncbi:MAG: hypothetical protein KAT65_15440 [Methanophagales archaeon]|nr:hypothetical protein [Methanophagales archaeon]